MSSTITSKIAHYAASTQFENLPAEVVERAKKVIFDEVACGFFGRRSAAGDLAARYSLSTGGKAEARIYGSNIRTSATYAALANGTAGHGEEVDGAHIIGGHPGATIVHAAMAMAERQRVSGAELINAVVLGYDVGVRIVEACGGKFQVRDRLHLTSDFFYAFGGTAAASRLLGLDTERHQHAYALTSFQTNGLYALYSEKRHISKSFCNGQFAFAGVSAALMAQAGLEGNEDIFGSEEGVIDAWGASNGSNFLTKGLGSEFAIMGANFKFFNAGYPIHTPVEAAMGLVKDHSLTADMITSVEIGMPENTRRVVDNRHMHNICVQDMIAASLAQGGLKLSDQPFPSILADPAYQRIRASIKVGVDPDIQREFPNGRGSRVTIITSKGEHLSRRIDNPRGHSLRGEVAWSDIEDKWRGSLGECDIAKALDVATNLEHVEDIEVFAQTFDGLMS